MIIILKKDANKQKVESLKTELVNQGFKLHLSEGTEASLIGLTVIRVRSMRTGARQRCR